MSGTSRGSDTFLFIQSEKRPPRLRLGLQCLRMGRRHIYERYLLPKYDSVLF